MGFHRVKPGVISLPYNGPGGGRRAPSCRGRNQLTHIGVIMIQLLSTSRTSQVAGMLNLQAKNLLGFQVGCDHRNVRKYPKPWFQREILGTLGRVP